MPRRIGPVCERGWTKGGAARHKQPGGDLTARGIERRVGHMTKTLDRPHAGLGGVRLTLLGLAVVIALGACSDRDRQRVLFDGVYFRTKAKAVKDDRQSFNVEVPKANRSINGAREAGRFEGTRYCIENFGTSDINWSLGPDAEDGRLVIENNDLRLSGRCVLW